MTSHQAFKKGHTDRNQVDGIIAALNRNLRVIQTLQAIRPFNRWADMCQADLAIARERILNGKFTYAIADLDKVVNSCRLRCLGFELEELIAKLSIDIALGQEKPGYYRRAIDNLIGQFGLIDEAGFIRPVIALIVERLQSAHAMLNLGPKEYDLKVTKSFLKLAADMI